MHSTGVEPVPLGSEDRCSIQLSYECPSRLFSSTYTRIGVCAALVFGLYFRPNITPVTGFRHNSCTGQNFPHSEAIELRVLMVSTARNSGASVAPADGCAKANELARDGGRQRKSAFRGPKSSKNPVTLDRWMAKNPSIKTAPS